MWLRDAVVPWQATSSSSASTGGKKNYSCRVVLPSRGLERGRGGWGPRLLSRPSLTRASATSVPRAHRRTFVAPFRSRYSRNRLFFCFSSFSPLFSLSLSLLGVLIVQTEIQKENALVPVCDQVGGVSAFNDMEWLSLRRR